LPFKVTFDIACGIRTMPGGIEFHRGIDAIYLNRLPAARMRTRLLVKARNLL